jgi:cytochrome c553
MRDIMALVALLLAAGLAVGAAPGSDASPAWAYPVNPPGLKPTPDDGMPKRVPNSDAAFTLTQIRNLFFAPDWHPGDHPAMPAIVAQGRKPDVLACGSCHRADGSGGPENARIAGLPAAYIVQQMADFKSGARRSAVPERVPPQLMIATAKAINDQEIEAAAAYFSALKPKSAIKIVETENVPKTQVAGWHLVLATDLGTEPIGQRIIEVPENSEHFESRDGWARFVAYVPPGSVQRGQALANPRGTDALSCGMCHGPGLKGSEQVPGIAGRSPGYVVRQLYDLKTGTRAGRGSSLMQPVVENLSMEDMIALAAYVASLDP